MVHEPVHEDRLSRLPVRLVKNTLSTPVGRIQMRRTCKFLRDTMDEAVAKRTARELRLVVDAMVDDEDAENPILCRQVHSAVFEWLDNRGAGQAVPLVPSIRFCLLYKFN